MTFSYWLSMGEWVLGSVMEGSPPGRILGLSPMNPGFGKMLVGSSISFETRKV